MEYQIGQANRLGNRNANEDRFAAFEADGTVLLALADGMGGVKGGATAAQFLVDTASEVFSQTTLPIKDVARFLVEIIDRAHRAIHDFARERQLANPPGTTGVLCLIQDGIAQWAHVGDSRLYVFRNELPLYRTRDHSYVERLATEGAIRPGDKWTHPKRNQITQCIGCMDQRPEIEIGKPIALAEGDLVVLCSDGFWSALEDVQMGTMLNVPDLDQATHELAETAERNSYPQSDNISVLALRLIATRNVAAEDLAADTIPLNPKRAQPVQLQDAIDQIEQVLKQYENEMNR